MGRCDCKVHSALATQLLVVCVCVCVSIPTQSAKNDAKMSDNNVDSLDFSLLNAAVANLCAKAVTATASSTTSSPKTTIPVAKTVPTTPTPPATEIACGVPMQLHSPSLSEAARVAGTDDDTAAADVGLSNDILSENYWLREKLQEIQSDRDRLMCEVANLRLELDMGELKRLPEHR